MHGFRRSVHYRSQHHAAAQHLFRYLNGTCDYDLTYDANYVDTEYKHLNLDNTLFEWFIGFTDSSFGDDVDDRKSTGGYLFMMANGIISFQSRKQNGVTLSTTESEYAAACEAAKEAIALRHLHSSLVGELRTPTLLFTDNAAARDHVRNNVKHQRTKHIDIKFHLIRHAFENGHIVVEHVPSREQRADILTKALPRVLHDHHIRLLNLDPSLRSSIISSR
jgi:hypothetical protein